MSLNKYMHPRNPFFENPPSFEQLAKLYPELSSYFIFESGKKKIDFKDPNALRALYCILMKNYFKLETDIPINHLIPRIPQRLNYILWVEDLLKSPKTAKGIDIGCGSSCVFDLLICSLYKDWTMLTSDIDIENIAWAKKNIDLNPELRERIQIVQVNNDTIFGELVNENESYDFVVCNPPFFNDELENKGISSAIRKPEKRHGPSSANTQRLHEAVYLDGGEVGFVKKIIDESIQIGSKIRIYTTMLGKKSSLGHLKEYLSIDKKINNVSDTQFCQGHTMRWGLAWSFNQTQLNQFNYFKKNHKNKPIIFEVNKDTVKNQSIKSDISFYYDYYKNLLLTELKLVFIEENLAAFKIKLKANENTWSHQRAKRRRKTEESLSKETVLEIGNDSHKELIVLNMQAKIRNKNSVILEFTVDDIEMKESLNQIILYIRNRGI